MLSIQRRGTGVLLTWCFIAVAGIYVLYIAGRYVFTVNGGYSDWSDFTSCTATCAGGLRTRTRTCTNPLPNFFGRNCSHLGAAIETEECNPNPCPINGKFGEWGEFGPCSVSCGDGTKTRERSCDNPLPKYGGANCQGESKETKPCNDKPCPVNGGYSEWTTWSECSVSCGGGQRTRSRECNKPEPQHGGKNCESLGAAKETEDCNKTPCIVPTTEVSAIINSVNNTLIR